MRLPIDRKGGRAGRGKDRGAAREEDGAEGAAEDQAAWTKGIEEHLVDPFSKGRRTPRRRKSPESSMPGAFRA